MGLTSHLTVFVLEYNARVRNFTFDWVPKLLPYLNGPLGMYPLLTCTFPLWFSYQRLLSCSLILQILQTSIKQKILHLFLSTFFSSVHIYDLKFSTQSTLLFTKKENMNKKNIRIQSILFWRDTWYIFKLIHTMNMRMKLCIVK